MADFTEAIGVLRRRATEYDFFADSICDPQTKANHKAAAADLDRTIAVLEAVGRMAAEDFDALLVPFKGSTRNPAMKLRALRDAVGGK